MAVFFAEFVGAFVLGAVWPFFHALAVLFVVDPIPLILGTVRMRVLAIPVRLVVLPVTVVYVTVGVDKSPAPICFIVFPIAFVNTTVTPNLIASAVFHASFAIPLAVVLGTVRKHSHRNFVFLNSWRIIFVIVAAILEFREAFTNLKDSLPLFFKFFRVHFNMYGTTLEKTKCHFVAVYFFDHPSCYKPPYKCLCLNYCIDLVLVVTEFFGSLFSF